MIKLFILAYLFTGLMFEIRFYRFLVEQHRAELRELDTAELAALLGVLFGWPLLLAFEFWKPK